MLAIALLSVYSQVGGHAFINVDDEEYVTGNPLVLRGLTLEGASWAFSTFHTGNWHPLTWISHMLDVELFGLDAGWHHRVSMLFHLANTVLLFTVFRIMTGAIWESAFVAALFAVHPLHVESVAWVSERKDVLSTLFWILTMWAYLRYTRGPGVRRYLLVVAFFMTGLMCKPMLVTLPLVLFLLDWWPLRRFVPGSSSTRETWRLIGEKIPLLALSVVSSAITYQAQQKGGAIVPQEILSLGLRISNAVVSYVAYLWKTIWPASLAVYYPHPSGSDAEISGIRVFVALFLLGALTFLFLREGRRRPYLAVGWLWYLCTLIPVIGLVQVGAQALADRYTYVPLIGIFLAMAWGVPEMSRGWRYRKPALGAIAGLLLVTLSMAARVQAGYWRDSVTLLSRAVAVTDRNLFALNVLGEAYEKLGKYDQAISSFQAALRIRPEYTGAWNNLGAAYGNIGQHGQAISSFREALRIRPEYAEAWNNLGVAYRNIGQFNQAISSFREALRIRPGFAEGWNNLGAAYEKLGQYYQAISSFREALRIRPEYADAWNNLGVAHEKLGQYGQAISSFQAALRIRPDSAEGWYNLGVVCEKLGQHNQAISSFREALRIRPDFAEGWNNLGVVYEKLGQRQQAIACFRESQRLASMPSIKSRSR